jgi:hypothetical protein
MADVPLPERLKQLQEQLLRIYAETVELCKQAEHSAGVRRHNDLSERRSISRIPAFRRKTDRDPSAS